MNKFKQWMERHPNAAKWLREGGLFFLFSNLVTVIQYIIYAFLPNLLGLKLAGIQWSWPAIPVTLFGIDFTWNAIGYDVLYDAAGNVIQTVDNVVGDALNAYTLTIPKGGTYYIASAGSGLYVCYAQYAPSSTPDPEEPVVPVIKGDLTGDGIINGFDLGMLKKDLLHKAAVTSANDMNGDGVLTVVDVVALTKFLLNRK